MHGYMFHTFELLKLFEISLIAVVGLTIIFWYSVFRYRKREKWIQLLWSFLCSLGIVILVTALLMRYVVF